MSNTVQFSCLASALLLLTLTSTAQSISSLPPVPPAITAAKSVFLSNAGSDSYLFPQPFSGDTDRAFRQFYAIVQGWHRYQLVTDPAQADLVLELQFTAQASLPSADKVTSLAKPLPMLRLVIYDRSTHYILWALTESIAPALLQKNHDQNFDVALDKLTNDLKRLTTQGVAGKALQGP
jgi:hypothetical protein